MHSSCFNPRKLTGYYRSSGKSSTILALFRGLSDALVSGRISIDGVDIHTLPRSRLRNSLRYAGRAATAIVYSPDRPSSLVAQDPFIWHSSIRSNLDPAEEHTDAEIWAALERVGMGDAVSGLPEKLDTVLEDGGSLSKGQVRAQHRMRVRALSTFSRCNFSACLESSCGRGRL